MKPRLYDKIYTRPVNKRPRTPWTFPISLFKDYTIETDQKVNECFEYDYSLMKFPRMTDEEMTSVKEELRKAYKTM